jgi:formate dehydrogenase
MGVDSSRSCCQTEVAKPLTLKKAGDELVVTSDKDGPISEFERFLPDAGVIISQPFWPAY